MDASDSFARLSHIGQALMEQCVDDRDSGRLLTPSRVWEAIQAARP